jgi:hypothetical protein
VRRRLPRRAVPDAVALHDAAHLHGAARVHRGVDRNADCCMDPTRRIAAARYAIAALLVIQALVVPFACAEGDAQLVLPLMTVMALGMQAIESPPPPPPPAAAPTQPLGAVPPPSHRSSVLPERLLIPDGYVIDLYRGLPHYAAPVDRDRIVGLDLLSRPRHGFTAALVYDQETRQPMQRTGEVFRFVIERRF